MARRRRYTLDDVRQAIADPTVLTTADLCRRLGLVPRGGNYELVRARVAELGVDPRERFPTGEFRDHLGHISDEALREALETNISKASALRSLGVAVDHAVYGSLKVRMRRSGIPESVVAAKTGRPPSRGRPVDETRLRRKLVAGRRTQSSELRKQLIAVGLKAARCEECDGTEWNGAPIPLELDHINGERTDNRLENLRLLCPNCHAQTPTYRGRNIGNGNSRA